MGFMKFGEEAREITNYDEKKKKRKVIRREGEWLSLRISNGRYRDWRIEIVFK